MTADVPSTATPAWPFAASQLLQLGIAYLLALPIGWNREREERSPGLRTFPIVAVSACGFAILGTSAAGHTADSYSRILQGLITGIGFIGGGVILHYKGTASGMATAFSGIAASSTADLPACNTDVMSLLARSATVTPSITKEGTCRCMFGR
jgi:hypothetical protein